MKTLTLGSLFDGSGGFPLGGLINGIVPVWASEIEPFPIRVTTKRLPFMKHYGDISKIHGAEIEPVDIITFGSPCQNMSMAGNRAGLEGEQSQLFFEALRIIKEMREKTNGLFPRFIVWENVFGAFSSNKGQDFRRVLEEVAKIKDQTVAIPMPEKWQHAGQLMGADFSIAWRLLDAQFWGVPQRRRRIYLVADFTGERAGQILFECDGMPRNFEPGDETGADIAGKIGKGIENAISFDPRAISRLGEHCEPKTFDTLRAHMGDNQICNAIPINMQVATRFQGTGLTTGFGVGNNGEPAFTLQAARPHAVAVENHAADSRIKINEDGKVQTLTSRMGTGGGNVPLVLNETKFALPASENNSFTLMASDYKEAQCVSMKEQESNCFSIVGNMIGRKDKNGPQGSGINENVSFTLNATDRHAVAYSSSNKDYSKQVVDCGYTVRRLTPLECCRLQGFPDYWCTDLGTDEPTPEEVAFWVEVFETHRLIMGTSTKPKTKKQIKKWLKYPYSDSTEYKMWGNGVALPCVVFVLAGILQITKD